MSKPVQAKIQIKIKQLLIATIGTSQQRPGERQKCGLEGSTVHHRSSPPVWGPALTTEELLSPWCARSFTPPHGLTKEMIEKGGGSSPALSEGMSHPSLEEGGTFALISPLIVPLPNVSLSLSLSLLMINQFHRPLWSVVSCYLDTSCHDLPGPLVFPWWQCAHPVISLAAPSWWPVATPGPDPQLPSSLPHGPIRLSVCVHIALQPFAIYLFRGPKRNFWPIVTVWLTERKHPRRH